MEHGAQPGDGRGVKQKRRLSLLPARRGDPRASVAAFVLQLVLLFVVVPSFLVPVAMDYLRDDEGNKVMPERISFMMAVPENSGDTREAPRAGGDGREASAEPSEPAAPIVAPSEIPTGVAPSAPGAARPDPGGTGPLVGGGGPTLGIRPSFNDPRLWVSPSGEIESMVPLTRADSLEIMLRLSTEDFMDSLRRATPAVGRAPGDWTFKGKNGKTYGIDQKYIRLGDFAIPTALLAFLPMNNVQGNPTAMDRARRLNSMRSEIMEQAERRARDDDFYAAVRALRARKEKERQEAQAAQQKSTVPPSSDR
jgi:hypothetical protein